MKKTKFLFCILTLSILSISGLHAQESINSAGGNVTSSGGSVSYSVGQVFYQTSIGANGSVSEGVQQPYEISVVTSIEEAKGINLSFTAYPNPTTDYLTLSVDNSVKINMSKLSYQLYDMNGKLLHSQKLTESKTQINMCNYTPASYFVRVLSGDKCVKEFKIIKQ